MIRWLDGLDHILRDPDASVDDVMAAALHLEDVRSVNPQVSASPPAPGR